MTFRRGWLIYLISGLLISVGAGLFRSSMLLGPMTQLVGWSSVVIGLAIAHRSRREVGRPWVFFALAAAAFLTAGIVRLIHGSIVGVERPLPSPADAIALSGHVCLIIGGTLLGHLRSLDRDRTAIIDGAIIAVGLQTVVWSFLLWPYMTDGSIRVEERAINAVYALMTLAVLATIGRLGVGPGARTLSYRLLSSAVFVIFLQDVVVSVQNIGGLEPRIGQALTPVIFVLFGAAALHPARLRIAEAPDRLEVRLSLRRVCLLVAALLMSPAMIAIQLTLHIKPTLVVATVSMTVLTLLVMARFTLLARTQERAVKVQGIQRIANAELAAASSRHAMHRAGLRAALQLLDDPEARVSVAQLAEGTLRVIDAMGFTADGAIGTSIALDLVPRSISDALAARGPGSADNVHAIDLGGSNLAAQGSVSVLVVPFGVKNAVNGAMIITTDRSLPATTRRSIETLASTVSLALESAALTENLLRRRSERRFRALVEHSSDVVLVVDRGLHITFASPATQNLLGLPEATVLGSHPARLVHPEDWPTVALLLAEHRDDHDHTADDVASTSRAAEAQVEVQLAHVDGTYRWFEVRARDLAHDPEIQGTVLTAREISDRKTSERQLAESEARFRALVQSSSDIVAVVDGAGCFTYVSPAVTEVLGFTPEELIGGPAMALMHPSDIAEFRISYPELATRRKPGDDFSTSSFEARVPHRSGEHRTLDITVSDMRDDPSVHGVVLNARDVTVRKALEADLRFQALHDSLTGLANRTRFTQETAHALRKSGTIGTVGALFIDLDDFKTVNDSLGHAVGDQLLQEVAGRLLTTLAPDDLAARLGGDEFAVLMAHADNEGELLTLAEELLEQVAQPFIIQGREIRVTASIGIAFASDETVDAEVLLRNADVAMYLAKDGGKSRYEVFEAHMHASVFERLELKADLARAIDDGQLRCFYQPIVSLQTGRITGVEALVRWVHPTRGFLSPDGFIPLAEESGLVVPLGRWVLREACQQLRTWQLRLPPAASLTMSVNLSVRQLVHETIVDDVRAAVADANLDPSTVTLEITETTLMHDTDLTRRRLAQLREIGVSLAVDDFGTGYSSLQYVQRFPIDVIKIDRSFVVGLGTNPGDGAVVQSMIELAQRLGVHTVAEGIDRPEQVTLLQSLGADLGQGFLFAEPLPAPDFDRLLDANPHDAPRVQLQ